MFSSLKWKSDKVVTFQLLVMPCVWQGEMWQMLGVGVLEGKRNNMFQHLEFGVGMDIICPWQSEFLFGRNWAGTGALFHCTNGNWGSELGKYYFIFLLKIKDYPLDLLHIEETENHWENKENWEFEFDLLWFALRFLIIHEESMRLIFQRGIKTIF